MFKYFLTKAFFRLVLLFALAGFVGVFFFAAYLDQKNPPLEDMHSPFTDSGRAVVDGTQSAHERNLSIRHLGGREVGMRLEEIVAEALNFNKDNFEKNASAMQKYFTPEGYKQYRDFLANAAIQQTLTAQNLQSGAYVEQEALELNSGVYNNVYKWVYEVPVTISFLKRGMESYRNEDMTILNRRFLLRAQFARVVDPADPEAIKIEIWQILPPRKTN